MNVVACSRQILPYSSESVLMAYLNCIYCTVLMDDSCTLWGRDRTPPSKFLDPPPRSRLKISQHNKKGQKFFGLQPNQTWSCSEILKCNGDAKNDQLVLITQYKTCFFSMVKSIKTFSDVDPHHEPLFSCGPPLEKFWTFFFQNFFKILRRKLTSSYQKNPCPAVIDMILNFPT